MYTDEMHPLSNHMVWSGRLARNTGLSCLHFRACGYVLHRGILLFKTEMHPLNTAISTYTIKPSYCLKHNSLCDNEASEFHYR